MPCPGRAFASARHSFQLLNQLAEQTGQTTVYLLDQALDAYRRKLFFEKMNAGYAELQADPEAWAEHVAERNLWDATLMDGLDPDEPAPGWLEDAEHSSVRSDAYNQQG